MELDGIGGGRVYYCLFFTGHSSKIAGWVTSPEKACQVT